MRPFDSSGTFVSQEAGIGLLKTQALRGAASVFVAGGVGQLIQLAATVALGRLLSPADFGVFAMVATFSMALANIGFNGFTEAVLQRADISSGLASNLFWLNVSIGFILTAGFAMSGGLLGRFYGNPDVPPVAGAMALTILLSTTSVLHQALLQRALRFAEVSANTAVARLVSVIVSVYLAWSGSGYWALVGGALAQAISVCAGSWWLCRWAPGGPKRGQGTGAVVLFALRVYGRFAVNYGTRNLDNALIGWRFNAVSLGYYKRAYDVFAMSASLLVSSLTPVAVATLSRLRDNPAEYRRNLLGSLNALTLGGMALGGVLTLIGGDVIRLLLGPQWDEAGRIFPFFGPGIGIMLIYGTHGWIHLSLGTPDRWFRWAVLEACITGLLFFLALRWGPVAVAVAWTVSLWILVLPALWYAGQPVGFPVRPVLGVLLKYATCSGAAGLATATALRALTDLPDLSGWAVAAIRIVVAGACFSGLYMLSIRVVSGGWAPLSHFRDLLRDMKSSKNRVPR